MHAKDLKLGADSKLKSSIDIATEMGDATLDNTVGFASISGREEALLPGEIINERYRVERMLGEGGMGVVYKAFDPFQPNRPVAVKTLRSSTVTGTWLELFKVEFRTMTKLSHPNVAAVYDFEPLQGTDHSLFTMEYVQGTDLMRATEGQRHDKIIELFVQVCRGLSYVHSRGLIHFDVKPANVLVTPEGQVKLLDFGVAGVARGGRVRGTPLYMAPEMVDSDAQLDHRADLYSLGIMAFHLLCRRLPFVGKSLDEIARLQKVEPLRFHEQERDQLPDWLVSLIERLCAKQPADRFRNANAVIETINSEGGFEFPIDTDETRASYILSSRFVGRNAELGKLTRFCDSRMGGAVESGAPAIWVVGQSGVGKSRLMKELRYQTQLGRTPFFEGNCYDGAFDEFGPIAELVRQAVPLAKATGAHDLIERFGPELAKIDKGAFATDALASSEPLETSEAEHLRLIEHASEFFVTLAEHSPFVLYVNDLQWAQPGSVEILSYIIRRVAKSDETGKPFRLAVLGSFRNDEIEDRPIERLLRFLESSNEYTSVILEPLESSLVSGLIASMLGIDDLPKGFVDRVTSETGGNPFFIEEVMRTLVENGSVYVEGGTWAASESIGELAIPTNMAKALLHRASLLDSNSRYLLNLLAVYGQPVAFQILQNTTQLDTVTVHESLAELERRRMIMKLSGDELRYGVSHDRMRETLYATIAEEERRALHRRIGVSLESVYQSDLEEVIYELAHHYWQSGEPDKAYEYSVAAAEKAKRGYANNLGIKLLGRVLELMPDSAREEGFSIEVTEKLGDMYYLVGKYVEASAAFEQVLATQNDALGRARIVRKQADILFQRGELQEAAGKVGGAIVLLGGSQPRTSLGNTFALLTSGLVHLAHRLLPFIARKVRSHEEQTRLTQLCAAYERLAYILLFIDTRETVLPTIRACNLADRLGTTPESAHAFSFLAFSYGIVGMFRSGLAYGRRSIEMAERIGSSWHIGCARLHTGIVKYYAGELEEGTRLVREADNLLTDSGDMFELASARGSLFWLLYDQGKVSDAMETSRRGWAVMERTGSFVVGKGLLGTAGIACIALGDEDRGLQEAHRSIEMCESAEDMWFGGMIGAGLSEVLLFVGDTHRALNASENALRMAKLAGVPADYYAGVRGRLAWALVESIRAHPEMSKQERLRRIRRARKLARIDRLVTWPYPNRKSGNIFARGVIAWECGRLKTARILLDKSIDEARRRGRRLELAVYLFETGKRLIERKDSLQDAQRYLEQAAAAFEECGCTHMARRPRQYLGEHNQPESPQKAAVGSVAS